MTFLVIRVVVNVARKIFRLLLGCHPLDSVTRVRPLVTPLAQRIQLRYDRLIRFVITSLISHGRQNCELLSEFSI